MSYVAHWGVVGSREEIGNVGFFPDSRPLPIYRQVEEERLVCRFDRTRAPFAAYWEFSRSSDGMFYVLSNTVPMSGGVRGMAQRTHFLLLPAEWVESEDCDLVSLLSLFPKGKEIGFGMKYKTGTVDLPEQGRKGYMSEFKDLVGLARTLRDCDGKVTVPGSHANERAELMCRLVDAIATPVLRRGKTFITGNLPEGNRFPVDCIVTGN